MNFFARAFTPTNNRRLNELVGFLLFVSALLLFLALATYSPADQSFNTASSAAGTRPARNWVGVVGAYGSDLVLQVAGITSFMLPLLICLLGMRWVRSRKVESWAAKSLGCMALLTFIPALLGLLPWHWRWMHAIPVEGLLGRIASDVLVQYLNVPGAYLISMSAIAVALYLTTTFSFGQLQLWFETRFAFLYAAWERVQDWR